MLCENCGKEIGNRKKCSYCGYTNNFYANEFPEHLEYVRRFVPEEKYEKSENGDKSKCESDVAKQVQRQKHRKRESKVYSMAMIGICVSCFLIGILAGMWIGKNYIYSRSEMGNRFWIEGEEETGYRIVIEMPDDVKIIHKERESSAKIDEQIESDESGRENQQENDKSDKESLETEDLETGDEKSIMESERNVKKIQGYSIRE